MRAVVDIGAMNKPLQVILEAENVPDCVRAGSLRLRQVLVNLLGNGVKFTDKGNVTFRCRPEGTVGEGNKLRLLFEVSDTGIGLPKDGAESLFESFVQADPSITRKFGGTGLGLAICYKLVKHLGGELSARNNEQGGALFSFVLPVEVCQNLNQPQEAVNGSEKGSDLVDYSGLKVMVAEDSKMNRILLRKV